MANESNSSIQHYGAYTVTHTNPKFENEAQKEAERQRIARQMVESYIALKTKK